MTKRRPPDSRHDAFTMACKALSESGKYDEAAELLGRSENTLRKLGDPDAEGEPTIWMCERLDRELKARGEEPINLLAYVARLGDRPATPESHLQRVILELRQAAKVIEATKPTPDRFLHLQRMLTVAQSQICELSKYLLDLHDRIPAGAPYRFSVVARDEDEDEELMA